MDGNGRWAKERGFPRFAGHKAGVETVREVVKASIEAGVPVLTLYAFSQENWKRPLEEISLLMNLLNFFLDKEAKLMMKEGVRFRTLGRTQGLPDKIVSKLQSVSKMTESNKKLSLNIALNYGARTEILDAVSKIIEEEDRTHDFSQGHKTLTEQTFANYLYTAGLPDPDLLIRTSGEMRLSNFLLWQLSYAEIYITKKYWPDFKKEDYFKALREYAKRERRFGDIGV